MLDRRAGEAWAETVFDVTLGVGNDLIRAELERIMSKVDIVRFVTARCEPERVIRDAAGPADPLGPPLLFLVLDELRQSDVELLKAADLHPVLLVGRPGKVDLTQIARVPSAGVLDAEDLTPFAVRDCLERIAIGEVPIPAPLAQRLLRSRTVHARRPRLTDREREVVPLLVEGMSNKQIARRLAISPHGAKRLVGNILAKLDSPNRTSAVTRILREGLPARPPMRGIDGATALSDNAAAVRHGGGTTVHDRTLSEMEPE